MPGVSSAVTPDGRVANKFSSPPTGTKNIFPLGYIFKTVSVFGDYPVRRYIQSSGCFFPAAGYRNDNTGALYYVGYEGVYWASSPSVANAYCLGFYSNTVLPAYGNNPRTYGFPVRCVKEFILVFYKSLRDFRTFRIQNPVVFMGESKKIFNFAGKQKFRRIIT
ncbi:MAG: fibrobacter succinogenes major paralogous domain-containing protein [Prevotella sp.]|nr:fibrobacter succinogenes major paralogous domain-containing protein [Prevotella sp.]